MGLTRIRKIICCFCPCVSCAHIYTRLLLSHNTHRTAQNFFRFTHNKISTKYLECEAPRSVRHNRASRKTQYFLALIQRTRKNNGPEWKKKNPNSYIYLWRDEHHKVHTHTQCIFVPEVNEWPIRGFGISSQLDTNDKIKIQIHNCIIVFSVHSLRIQTMQIWIHCKRPANLASINKLFLYIKKYEWLTASLFVAAMKI